MLQMKKLARLTWMQQLAADRPVLFSLLVILVSCLLTEIPLDPILLPLVGNPAARFLQGIVEQCLVGLALVWLLARLGLLGAARFTPPSQWRALWLGWPLALLTLLNLSSLFGGSLAIDTSRPGLIVLYVCFLFSIGFFEEVMGRGVVLQAMLRKWGSTRRGIYVAVLASSALFGVAHLVNLATGRLPLLACLTQIAYSLCFGVIFAACVLRNNSIWPMIVMHAAFDFGGSRLRDIAVGGGGPVTVANNTAPEALTAIAITLPLLVYGLFILRKVAPPAPADAAPGPAHEVAGHAVPEPGGMA